MISNAPLVLPCFNSLAPCCMRSLLNTLLMRKGARGVMKPKIVTCCGLLVVSGFQLPVAGGAMRVLLAMLKKVEYNEWDNLNQHHSEYDYQAYGFEWVEMVYPAQQVCDAGFHSSLSWILATSASLFEMALSCFFSRLYRLRTALR